ncbi:MAG TPA: cold shock domain-containing protein [Bacteroidetes bacterium]|nr:cold shock domain-containing protein [Bacteroidota bacterium]
MARSQETFNKKEREKKRRKKQKEKAERKEQRKLETRDGKSFDDMVMYVDEYGNLTPTPPDPSKKLKFKKEDMEISIPKKGSLPAQDPVRKGTVKFFNDEKGYGFIVDRETRDSIFVHANGLIDQIRDNDRVSFEVKMGPKGPNAVAVKLVN